MRLSFCMKTQLTWIGVAAVSLSLMGCQATRGAFERFDDGSTAYTKATPTQPLQIPANQATAPFVPLYNVPEVGENTLDLSNERDTRFVLPAPRRATN